MLYLRICTVMAKKRVSRLRCPICRKVVLRTHPEFPFCSERCRVIDLGKWASGEYVVSTPIDRGDQSGEADYTTGLARKMSRPGGHPGTPRRRPDGQDGGQADDRAKRG